MLFSLVAIGLFVGLSACGVVSNYSLMIIPLGALVSIILVMSAYFLLDENPSRPRR